MLRSSKTALVAVLALGVFSLALPTAALAQGAGDDQYADPFGDMPVDDGGGGGGGGSGDGGSDGGGSTGSEGTAGTVDTTTAVEGTELVAAAPDSDAGGEELARTGLPAGLLAILGLGLFATGALLHVSILRLAPGSRYARAWPLHPVHSAPRPPGFPPPRRSGRFRR